METDRADVLVVGASPAGLAAAREAARGGADVLVCEARRDLGIPASPATVVADVLWPTTEPAPPADVVVRRYAGFRLLSPRGASIRVEASAAMLDRARFDRWLWWRAEDEGARLRTNARFTHACRGRAEGPGARVEADVILFADGPSSLARRFLDSVERPGWQVSGIAFETNAPGIGEGRHVDVAVGSHAPWGRSQLNPVGGDAATFWVFHRGGAPDVGAARRIHARALGIAPEALRLQRVGAGFDPVLTTPRVLAGEGVLVAGGAAGQAGVEMGLAAGAMAGQWAAEAVRRRDFSRRVLAGYERAWKRRYRPGFLAYRRGMSILDRVGDAELNALMETWGERPLDPRLLLDLAHPRLTRRVRGLARCMVGHPAVGARVARVIGLTRTVERPA